MGKAARKIFIALMLLAIAVLSPQVLVQQPLYISIPAGLIGLGWIVVGILYLLDKLPGR